MLTTLMPTATWDEFNGTSSAAAIVGGVVACLQGRAKQALGGPLTPERVRRLLATKAYGKPQPRSDAKEYPIGPLPDLRKLFEAVRID